MKFPSSTALYLAMMPLLASAVNPLGSGNESKRLLIMLSIVCLMQVSSKIGCNCGESTAVVIMCPFETVGLGLLWWDEREHKLSGESALVINCDRRNRQKGLDKPVDVEAVTFPGVD